jgi:predicted nucleic acid-binding protein
MSRYLHNSFEYNKDSLNSINKTEKNVLSVLFNINRFEDIHLIRFTKMLTEEEAVKEAEKWLSQASSKEYYNSLKNHCFNYDDLDHSNYNRSVYLSDAIYLEVIKRYHVCSDYHIMLICGS